MNTADHLTSNVSGYSALESGRGCGGKDSLLEAGTCLFGKPVRRWDAERGGERAINVSSLELMSLPLEDIRVPAPGDDYGNVDGFECQRQRCHALQTAQEQYCVKLDFLSEELEVIAGALRVTSAISMSREALGVYGGSELSDRGLIKSVDDETDVKQELDQTGRAAIKETSESRHFDWVEWLLKDSR